VRDGAGHGGQEVEPVTDDDVRAGLEAQRLEREERWI